MKKIICILALFTTSVFAFGQSFTTITIPATASNLANVKTIQDAWASKPADFTGAAKISGPPTETFLAPVMDNDKTESKEKFSIICNCNLNIEVIMFNTSPYKKLDLEVGYKGILVPNMKQVVDFISLTATNARTTFGVK